MPAGKPKGYPKTGGRQKGTKNKDNMGVLERLNHHGINLVDELVALLPELKPERQMYLLNELMQYCYPKKKSLEVSGNLEVDNKVQVLISLPSNSREVSAELLGDTPSALESPQEADDEVKVTLPVSENQ